MRRRLRAFWVERRDRLGDRLRYGSQRRIVRCPACGAMQAIYGAHGLTKIICRRCGEIYLRRL